MNFHHIQIGEPAEYENPLLLKRKEAATLLRINVRTLDKLLRNSEIPHVRMGRTVRVRATDLDAFCKNKTAEAAGKANSATA